MKRVLTLFILILIFTSFLSLNASAESTDQYISEQLIASGADELYYSLPQDTRDMLSELGIEDIDHEKILNVSPQSVFELFLSLFKANLKTPFSVMGILLSVMLLASVIQSFTSSLSEGKSAEIYELISAFIIGIIIIVPIGECITDVAGAIELSAGFMTAFIPVFVAVIISTGKPLTALTFNGLVFGLAEFITYISNNFILPITTGFLSFSLVGSFSSGIKIDNIIAFSKKCITVIMGFMSTVFVSLLCMKGFVSGAADTVGTKASKFLLGSFLPVVGSAMGEAMSTVKQCLNLVKSTVGAFGITGILLIYVPVIISVLSWQLVLFICKTAGEMLSLKCASSVIRAISTTLTLLISVLVFCTFLLVISVAVILMVKGE